MSELPLSGNPGVIFYHHPKESAAIWNCLIRFGGRSEVCFEVCKSWKYMTNNHLHVLFRYT